MEELNITGDESFNCSTSTALLILSSSLDREIVNAYKLSINVFPEGHSITGTIAIKVFAKRISVIYVMRFWKISHIRKYIIYSHP